MEITQPRLTYKGHKANILRPKVTSNPESSIIWVDYTFAGDKDIKQSKLAL